MKKIVTFGEIMLRLSPPNQLRFGQARTFDVTYGGGESNVAVSLANYGLETEYVTRLTAITILENLACSIYDNMVLGPVLFCEVVTVWGSIFLKMGQLCVAARSFMTGQILHLQPFLQICLIGNQFLKTQVGSIGPESPRCFSQCGCSVS